MTPCKILVVLGLALAGPFSTAQEVVKRGNQKQPYQPPAWISHLIRSESVGDSQPDGFIIPGVLDRPINKHPTSSGIKYPCFIPDQSGVSKWQFCDMR